MRTDLTNEEYHAHDAISSSDVKLVHTKSLAHWKNKVRKESAAFALGSAVHAMILEPHRDLVRRGPEDRRGNKWKEAQLAADLDGQILLTESDYDLADRIAASVKAHPVAALYLASTSLVCEASFFATDSRTGVEIKCRPDGFILDAGIVFDVKTTNDASPGGFPREVTKYAYDVQAAFYLRALREAGHKPSMFAFVAVEKEPPHAVGIHVLTDEYMKRADAHVTQALLKIANGLATKDFPTGWPLVNHIDLPRWQTDPTEHDVFDEQNDF